MRCGRRRPWGLLWVGGGSVTIGAGRCEPVAPTLQGARKGSRERRPTAHNRPLMDTRPTRIQVCGHLQVEIEGERVEAALPGRQGRLLLAYLILTRGGAGGREELIEALWAGESQPAAGDALLRPPLSRLRKALGPGRIEGRG